MPVLESFYLAFGDHVDFFVAGQTLDGNTLLRERHNPSFSVLDDTSLKVSFAYDIDTVPTLFMSDEKGNLKQQLIGFVRDEWEKLAGELSDSLECPAPELAWESLPAWRPGCGSLSVDPTIADRLRAESENHTLDAKPGN